MTFQPGDEVVCVDAGPVRFKTYASNQPSGLVAGATYVVEAVFPAGYDTGFGGLIADQVTIVGTPKPSVNPAPGFWADRFRKVERRRDMQSWLASQPADFEGPVRRVLVPDRERP